MQIKNYKKKKKRYSKNITASGLKVGQRIEDDE